MINNTPLGSFSDENVQRLISSKIIRYNEESCNFSILSEKVIIVKDDEPKEYYLPIRYYNMKYLLWKYKDFDRAYSEFIEDPTIYIPLREGYTSYFNMLDATLKTEYSGEKKVDMVNLAKQIFIA